MRSSGSEDTSGSATDLDAYLDVVTPGLPDKLFVQGEAAMSREEARALALCKARLKRGMVVYEIGAGTGSWTVEAARLVAPGAVWAVEKNPAAAALVRANLLKFGITNVRLVEGNAPEACLSWPPADCILIGGSGGRLREILETAGDRLRPGRAGGGHRRHPGNIQQRPATAAGGALGGPGHGHGEPGPGRSPRERPGLERREPGLHPVGRVGWRELTGRAEEAGAWFRRG